jgi:hypothetical protein
VTDLFRIAVGQIKTCWKLRPLMFS